MVVSSCYEFWFKKSRKCIDGHRVEILSGVAAQSYGLGFKFLVAKDCHPGGFLYLILPNFIAEFFISQVPAHANSSLHQLLANGAGILNLSVRHIENQNLCGAQP